MADSILRLIVMFLSTIALIVLLNSCRSIFRLTQAIQHQILQKYEAIDHEVEDSEGPKVIWLMSFPNSGNSYTTTLIRGLTNKSTATNYGEDHINKNGLSETIENVDQYKNGPFLVLNSNKERLTNGKYILTKTHCGGRCSRCGPADYIETLSSFKQDCLTARKAMISRDGSLMYNKVQYDANLVVKAVHIIRDPMDNIVSRYHLFLKMIRKEKVTVEEVFPESTKDDFTNDAVGFAKWCQHQDNLHVDEETRLLGEDTLKIINNIPCYADFFRYIQWHNRAFEVVTDMNIPSLIIHYEDFAKDFNKTKDRLLHFLEDEEVVSTRKKLSTHFVLGKNYDSYYTSRQRSAIINAINRLCNDRARNQILPYYFNITLLT